MNTLNFTHSKTPAEGAAALTARIKASLEQGRRTLWLVAGGSNVPITADIMRELRAQVPADKLKLLTISQTDERFGPVGHPDSNWKQLLDLGFDDSGITTFHILAGLPLQETAAAWAKKIVPIFDSSDVIIAQFGIGADGHIAGMLPYSPAVTETSPTSGYDSPAFTRLSLTPPMLRKINVAYVMAFGESKRIPLAHLKNEHGSIADQPLQILKEIPEVHVYSDVV